jgi:mRNA interferase MazF
MWNQLRFGPQKRRFVVPPNANPFSTLLRKTRPAIVLSNNAANAALNRVIVVPLTSRTEKLYPGEAMVTINGEQSKAKADKIATASKQRLCNKAGSLSSADLAAVEKAVLLQSGIHR